MKNLKNKSLGKKIAIGVLIFLVISGLFSLYSAPLNEIEKISLSQLAQEINENKVKQIEVEGDKLAIELEDGTKQESLKSFFRVNSSTNF